MRGGGGVKGDSVLFSLWSNHRICRHLTKEPSDRKSGNTKHLQPNEGAQREFGNVCNWEDKSWQNITFCFGTDVIIFLINYLQKEVLY